MLFIIAFLVCFGGFGDRDGARADRVARRADRAVAIVRFVRNRERFRILRRC